MFVLNHDTFILFIFVLQIVHQQQRSALAPVRKLLAIPDPWYTAAAIPIGYPVGRGHGPLIRRPVEQLAYLDTWGKQI